MGAKKQIRLVLSNRCSINDGTEGRVYSWVGNKVKIESRATFLLS
jgi:hypothetical protein